MITTTALHTNPLFNRLTSAERILVVGVGGGFDVYAGLPVALSLLHQGKEVHLVWPTSRSAPPKACRSTTGSLPT